MATYTVKPGDTLWDLAQRYGTTVQALAKASGIKNPNRLSIGQKITVPAPASVNVPLPIPRPNPVVIQPSATLPIMGGTASGSADLTPTPILSASGSAQAGTGISGSALPMMAASVGAAAPAPAPSLTDVLNSRYSSVAPSPAGADPSSYYAPGLFPSAVAPNSSSSQELQNAVNAKAASMVPTLSASGAAYAGTDPPGSADLGPVDPRVIDTMIAEAGSDPVALRAVAATIANRASQRGQTPFQVVSAPNQYAGYSSPGSLSVQAQQMPWVRANAERAWNDIISGAVPDPTNGGTDFRAASASSGLHAPYGTVNIGGNVFAYGNGSTTGSRTPDTPALDAINSVTNPLPAPSPLTPESMSGLVDSNPPPPLPRSRPNVTAPASSGWLGNDAGTGPTYAALSAPTFDANMRSTPPQTDFQLIGSPEWNAWEQSLPHSQPGQPTLTMPSFGGSGQNSNGSAFSDGGWGSEALALPIMSASSPQPTYSQPTTRYTVQQMTSLNPAYEKYIASQKADDIGPGPGSLQDLVGNFATSGATAYPAQAAPPQYITQRIVVPVTAPPVPPVAVAQAPIMQSTAPAQPPGTSFLQARGVDTSNMSAGQQANALNAALSGGQHEGHFGI
jgi:hypothetical protein